ncbi:hypothetical protein MnTg02_01270 [bacterium MnTg02]|nr:hypothetical protein MnTg02_01270 [bacterium MnTg02]
MQLIVDTVRMLMVSVGGLDRSLPPGVNRGSGRGDGGECANTALRQSRPGLREDGLWRETAYTFRKNTLVARSKGPGVTGQRYSDVGGKIRRILPTG